MSGFWKSSDDSLMGWHPAFPGKEIYTGIYRYIWPNIFIFMKTVLPINGTKHPRFIKKVDEAELNL